MESVAIGIDIGSLNTVIGVARKRGIEILQTDQGNSIP